MLSDLSINPSQTSEKIIEFIKEVMRKAGFHRVVIGLSGGIDSAVSSTLAVQALGAQNVYIGIFPYGDLNKKGKEDALHITNRLAIQPSNTYIIDIKPIVDAISAHDIQMNQIRRGNIAVRMRMILLYDLAKKLNSLVLGTENKTEYLLGYFTRFGDEASDIEPIINLYKTQVRQLAKYLQLPDKIISKVPTAGMWQGQTDEGELGFTYDETDKILYLTFDKKVPADEIAKYNIKKQTIQKVLKRVEENKFKHKLPFVMF